MPERKDASVTSEQVLEVLQTCYDPCCKERAVSVVELGLIQDVQVALQMMDQNLHAIDGVGEVDIEIVWNTVWTPERMSASARQKLTLPMTQLLPLRQRRLEREAREA